MIALIVIVSCVVVFGIGVYVYGGSAFGLICNNVWKEKDSGLTIHCRG